MENWQNPLFLVSFSTGVVFIITAILSAKYPPKGINRIYGYRTKSSMKSIERWNFAQEYSSDLMHKYGILLTLIGIAGYFIRLPIIAATMISIATMLVLVIALIYKTEHAIKR